MDTELSTLPVSDVNVERPLAQSWSIRWIYPADIPPPTLLSDIADRPLVLGRRDECDVPLRSPAVSRDHAELRAEGRNVVLRDLNSRNGVFVNGQRSTRRLLCRGDLVRVGDCVGRVEESANDASSPPAPLMTGGFYVAGSLRAALEPLKHLAKTDLPILIQGESGTGKEGTARTIHEWSGRAGAFVAINCAALPPDLAEAELFGYRRGAFSGAEQGSLGYLRAATGGTLFLDEVIELPLTVQAKLLRAIELNEVLPLGESRPVKVEVRVLSAAQIPLAAAVSAGKFRPDLQARLNGYAVELPPLRHRIADLPSLLTFLLSQATGGRPPEVEAKLVERLCLHDWPGNVRELSMTVRRLLGLHGHEPRLLLDHVQALLPPGAGAPRADATPLELSAGDEGRTKDERDLANLLQSLRTHHGNVAKAAVQAGVSRQRAYRLLQSCPGFALSDYRRTEGT